MSSEYGLDGPCWADRFYDSISIMKKVAILLESEDCDTSIRDKIQNALVAETAMTLVTVGNTRSLEIMLDSETTEIETIIFSPSVDTALQTAQNVHRRHSDIFFVFLTPIFSANNESSNEWPLAPRIGSAWVRITLDESVVAMLKNSFQTIARGSKMRTTLHRSRSQLMPVPTFSESYAQMVRRTGSLLELALESIPNGIVMIDQDGKIVLINKKTEELFGYTRTELLDQPIEILVPNRFKKDFALLFKGPSSQIVRSGLDFSGLLKVGTEIPIEINFNKVKTDDGMFTITSVVDITVRNQAEEELLRSKQRLEELDVMKSQFIAVLSHELRTPIAAAMGATENLLRGRLGEITNKQEQSLLIVKRNSKRMSRMVADLLNLSQMEIGEITLDKKPMRLGPVIEKLVLDHEVLAKQGDVEIAADLPTAAVSIFADEDRVIQMITNLLENAIRYANKSILVSVSSQDGEVSIIVEDDGIGIPEGNLEQIFERFQIVKPLGDKRGTGLGLGLAIVKGLVEAHRGTVIAENIGNKEGTRFVITLPIEERAT